MRAIMVMFDSLNRRMLPNYGGDWVHAPNFQRLASRTVTFDNCYGGSMPCMPARREMHTGRYNFLHRSWGPLEPFDDSVPAMLKAAGVHTHLATDHQHYWEDGGATYHNRYSTYEFFRGQEGDPWKGQVADPEIPDSLGMTAKVKPKLWRQDWVNRAHLEDKADHPQTLTFDAGVEFIETNKGEDSWFVQIETFDPHEPFFSYAEYKTHYAAAEYDGPHFDWPDYAKVTETPEAVEHARAEYAALLTMCDESLGRVLDLMDENDMWNDTMLIVCTDHGFMLGEHGWWGKNVQPWYDETIHNPLFVWDPRAQVAGERRGALVQTIDFGPTLLDFFGVDPTADMQGSSLAPVVADDTPVREYGLFGVFGGHVCVTDGRYVYMRASATPQNQPLSEHTLMPTVMTGFFPQQQLAHAQLVDPLPFTKGLKVLKTPAQAWVSPYAFGTQLFDLHTDPEQIAPLRDADLELRLATALRDAMTAADAPTEQFARLGLPETGPLTEEHLLIDAQWQLLQLSLAPAASAEDFGADGVVLDRPIAELLADPRTRAVLVERAPMLAGGPMIQMIGGMSLLQIAAMMVGLLPRPVLAGLAQLLTAAEASDQPVPVEPVEQA
ncbi:arylsulfatase A-like enzyme [Microbacterium terrae]|uniref:Choline-sulfatase n=1 Tax=Microbacterium terrae TaxID=69369 RepID=A0A0M2HA59_9MICO|nr:sulfatase [Microbacterium terrae]KJL40905.1 Choline-sulfatase [Microbacterium terrae]MBP1078194.1 arylsulfatase A-like enzyme [Microbacterium terrae]GLJ97673.1 sulfatase [Microbacterium terrae]